MTQADALTLMKMGKNIFLTGAAGAGKTYVLNQYIEHLKEHKVETAITASTGIAATHIGGMTIHSWSGIGIKDQLSAWDLDSLEQKKYLWTRFKKVRVLIIDEVSMLSNTTLDTINQVCKLFKRSDEPFGGMQVILSGDFFQLPPIVKKSVQVEEVEDGLFDGIDESFEDQEQSQEPFAFKSKAWEQADFHTCYLTEQHRQDDSILLDILNAIRSGLSTELSKEDIICELKGKICTPKEDLPKLYSHNRDVDAVNNKKLKALSDKSREYKMQSHGKESLCEGLKRGCLAPEFLQIKKGALVMFVQNSREQGYVNGTIGEVIDFEEGYPVVQTKDDKRYIARPGSWSVENNGKALATIEQVPLKLAWAVTIHKSQGMTLSHAFMDLSQVFVAGQGYVALSRVQSLEGLHLGGLDEKALEVHPEILEFDTQLQKESESLSRRLEISESKKIEEYQKGFLKRNAGSAAKTKEDATTFEKTRELLLAGKSIEEIAQEREVKTDTVFNHIETLLKEEDLTTEQIDHLRSDIKKKDFKKIVEAFEESDDIKLTPVFEILKEEYDYEVLKVVRLFL